MTDSKTIHELNKVEDKEYLLRNTNTLFDKIFNIFDDVSKKCLIVGDDDTYSAISLATSLTYLFKKRCNDFCEPMDEIDLLNIEVMCKDILSKRIELSRMEMKNGQNDKNFGFWI